MDLDRDGMEEEKGGSATASARPPKPKVVHISNPMRLETSPSNFRSVVQELTGQHAVWPVDPARFISAGLASTRTADPSELRLQQQPTADERVVLIHHHMLHDYMLHDHQDFPRPNSSSSS